MVDNCVVVMFLRIICVFLHRYKKLKKFSFLYLGKIMLYNIFECFA